MQKIIATIVIWAFWFWQRYNKKCLAFWVKKFNLPTVILFKNYVEAEACVEFWFQAGYHQYDLWRPLSRNKMQSMSSSNPLTLLYIPNALHTYFSRINGSSVMMWSTLYVMIFQIIWYTHRIITRILFSCTSVSQVGYACNSLGILFEKKN